MADTDDIRTYFDRNFIQAFDLQGRDVTITIAGVRKEKIRGRAGSNDEPKSKAIIQIQGRDLSFIPCKTDATKTIPSLYGFKTKDWIGKQITIYPTTTMAFGQQVECIRVRPTAPKKGAKDEATREPGED